MKKPKETNVLRTPARLTTWLTAAVAMLLALAVASRTDARPTPPPLEDPAHWATITHPGNAAYTFTQSGQTYSKGRVDYEYRISKTEVTGEEWFEFVNAYAPYVPFNLRRAGQFVGDSVSYTEYPDGSITYSLRPGLHDYAAGLGWRFAARYCNWLHNGKVNEAWAFESGVYDTSTFTTNPNGSINDQRTRSPGARFWIPTEDEWIKAVFFDPDRHGENMPGYWQYPYTSDTQPVAGIPGVGQTDAGSDMDQQPSGSYPGSTTPWGLLDASGGYEEWTETPIIPDHLNGGFDMRAKRGSFFGSTPLPTGKDWISNNSGAAWPANWSRTSLRIASSVPAPGPAFGMAMAAVLLISCRRR